MAADAPRLLGGVTPTRSPVMGHEIGSTSADRAGGGFSVELEGRVRGSGRVRKGLICQMMQRAPGCRPMSQQLRMEVPVL